MKPGRLPEDHPLEQQARAKLREFSPQAQAAREAQHRTAQDRSTRPDMTPPRPEYRGPGSRFSER